MQKDKQTLQIKKVFIEAVYMPNANKRAFLIKQPHKKS
jgi:hypothetical protein